MRNKTLRMLLKVLCKRLLIVLARYNKSFDYAFSGPDALRVPLNSIIDGPSVSTID